MAAPAGLVIATGGGAVVNPANREALAAGGTVICLEADLGNHPPARRARATTGPCWPARIAWRVIRELLAARAEAYAAMPASPGQDPPDHPSHGRARDGDRGGAAGGALLPLRTKDR